MNPDVTDILKKHKPGTFLIPGILFVLIIIFLCVAPTKTITHDSYVTYPDTETYYEKEPFEVLEAYQEQEPYQTVETYTDIVTVPVNSSYEVTEYAYQTYGSLPPAYYAPSAIPKECICSGNRYMADEHGDYADRCVQILCTIPYNVTKYRTEMQNQSVRKERTVTDYRNVTKYRNVTHYRDVQRTREVIRIRNESQPIEVNWLFGFRTPYRLHLPIISGD